MSDGLLLLVGLDTEDDPRVSDDEVRDPEVIEIAATKLDMESLEIVASYRRRVRAVVHHGALLRVWTEQLEVGEPLQGGDRFPQAVTGLLRWAGNHVMAWMATPQDRWLWRHQARRDRVDPDLPWPFIDLSELFEGLDDVNATRSAFAVGWLANQERCAASRLPCSASSQTSYVAEFLGSQPDLSRELRGQVARFRMPDLGW
jgi:hypothetical protein